MMARHKKCEIKTQLQIALHVQRVAWHGICMLMTRKTMSASGTRGCRNTSLNFVGAQVMQSYLPGPSTYQLSEGTGIKCRAARERGQDIISLKVGAAVCCAVPPGRVSAQRAMRTYIPPAGLNCAQAAHPAC